MALGFFIFALKSAPYQTLAQETHWRHAKNERIGTAPHYQYLGPGEDKITLSGVLYPEITGGDISLSALRTMAYSGKAWPLVEATGTLYGLFAITSITETRTEFFADGKAAKIEFSLVLEKVSEDLRERLGDLTIAGLGERFLG